MIKIDFAYGRFSFFQFMCEVIGHIEKDRCNDTEDAQNCGMGWGK